MSDAPANLAVVNSHRRPESRRQKQRRERTGSGGRSGGWGRGGDWTFSMGLDRRWGGGEVETAERTSPTKLQSP